MRIKGLHHARFISPDLARLERFANDFGLHTVARDGGRLFLETSGGCSHSVIVDAGSQRRFTGFAFEVEGMSDLQQAVDRGHAQTIYALDRPGGGFAVSLSDPDGNLIELVTGIAISANDTHPQPDLTRNSPTKIARRGFSQQGRIFGPAYLFRLGHIGLYVRDFGKSAAWYRNVLGLLDSEIMHAGDPELHVAGFMRLDRGEEWVDHHILALLGFGRSDCHHISFEVQDFEAQFIAHRWLQSKGWEPNWGVGRHPLGSHVFDTWFSPDRYRFETYSDTDLLTAAAGAAMHDVRETVIDLWSSEPTDRYFA